MGTERRVRLIELSRQHGFVIVADEVYQLLHYQDEPPPAFGTMIESDTVLSLGSFSKILAPGMRVGWIQSGPRLRSRLLESGFINGGGSISHYASHIVRHAIDPKLLRTPQKNLRRCFKRVERSGRRRKHKQLHRNYQSNTESSGGSIWCLESSDPPVVDSGSGVLARVRLEAVGEGESPLRFGERDINGDGSPDRGTLLKDVDARVIGDENGDSFFDGPRGEAIAVVGDDCPAGSSSVSIEETATSSDSGFPWLFAAGAIAALAAAGLGGVLLISRRESAGSPGDTSGA